MTLSEVRFASAWQPFFAALPGWRQLESGRWEGQGASVRVDEAQEETEATLEIRNPVAGDTRLSLSRRAVTQAPAAARAPAPAPAAGAGRAVLNHVAIDLPEADTKVREWLRDGEAQCFLPKAGRFDPSAGETVVAEHLIGAGGDYVTLRYLPGLTAARLSHVGFQFASVDSFKAHEQVLREVGWPILIGPEEIDGSLVIHFTGPDGLVHDLFHVLDPGAGGP